MTKTCPDCHAEVLSTSQPDRMGTAPEMQAALAAELRKWWSFDDRQMHTHSWHSREDFIERKLPEWIAALASTPAVGGEGSTARWYSPGRACIAKLIWHRFAKGCGEFWEDEKHQAEYLDCADEILAEMAPLSAHAQSAFLRENADPAHDALCGLKPAVDGEALTSPLTRHLRMIASDVDDSHWAESINSAADILENAAQPASPLRGRESLETLIREYARDLRRNSSGGDDYPWEIMNGVADYLDILIGRASPPEQPAAAPVRRISMDDVRLVAGEGKLTASTVLEACNAVIRMRSDKETQA